MTLPAMAATPPSPASTTSPTVAAAPSESPPHGEFRGLSTELNDQLEVETTAAAARTILKVKDGSKPYLPGQPRIRLNLYIQNPHSDYNELLEYLRDEHLTNALDELLPFMRYIFVQTPSYRHIMPLHHQKAHAREVIVDEKPGLHLVWYYDRIFIKPIPAYFYSRAFWKYLENADEDVFRAALGFMRTYYYLIRYEIDFQEACRLCLVPKKPDGKPPTYEEFCDFMEPFSTVDNKHVSPRFHYGEMRLTRINRTAMVFRRQLAYYHIFPQWGSFLTHILAPVITVFAVFSVVLNSMQVGLAALDMGPGNQDSGWPAFIKVSIWFPVAIIIMVAIIVLAAALGIVLMGVRDFIRGNKVRRRIKRDANTVDEKSHGMVW